MEIAVIVFVFLWMILSLDFAYILVRSFINGAVYYPTSKRNVETIVAMAHILPGTKAADLGSGDGRIVIAMAKAGAYAHGYEINPPPCLAVAAFNQESGA